MSQLEARIAQFRKMASDDPDNELGHFRLGQLLTEDNQLDEAAKSYERALELSPNFSKVYQLLAEVQIKQDQTEKAIATLTKGREVAGERGDRIPRDAMGAMLRQLGQEVPDEEPLADVGVGPTGFQCSAPQCRSGDAGRQLPGPPIPGEEGERIHKEVCAQCWEDWFRNMSIKVINELHLDLSTPNGQAEYDKYMREYFGFEG